MLHPDMLAAILKSGRHEVGVHGWIHEFTPRLAEGEEERLLDPAIAFLTTATGKRPVGEGTLFVLTLHPYLSGHRAPMKHLDEFVAYMKAKRGVWFATGAQIAAYLKGAR